MEAKYARPSKNAGVMRTLVTLLAALALALALPAAAPAFTCSRHSAPVAVTGGELTDVSTGQPVTDKIDDAGTYELQKGATAVVTIGRATATIEGVPEGKAAFRFTCYQYHSDKPQSLIKMFFGRTRVKAPAADAKKIGVSSPEGLANMVVGKRTDFTVSRAEGVKHKRTYVTTAKGAAAVLVGAFVNLSHHSPCTGGHRLVIEPNGRIHPG
ncbi:MAG TPA: hypothetical protein VGJ70_04625 [Solirubrobacteraceae bacterium]